MIPLEKYATAKDHCCLGYFGPELAAVRELLSLRPRIESALPGLRVYIACRPEFVASLGDAERVVGSDQLKCRRHEFAYFQEVRCLPGQTVAEVLLPQCKEAHAP